ncbi:phytoene desaturase family protein [Halodesulfurarchaeum sp. HSR-GB]|uniref:phytoene desaturase family protein n=1 Tax=Halodesulfurarchaeum sp. HSR-GB TaxID=3074077 RepID=UPI00285E07E8|nr:phytoene desaturase family protein [Halodesulfurarchaeum sp. HSR-GB]MDR5655858.1 phytoene desaturase family protein [Halodesulfurarchaeum sp. HSR-GB]
MTVLSGRDVTVVGAGFGGLATAAYLADAGADVRVIEKNEELGGRAAVMEAEGFRFDMGPSWYLMPDVFERFFDHFDRSPGEFYDLEHLDPHYRLFFKENVGPRPDGDPPGLDRQPEGDRIDITPDLDRTIELFEAFEDGAGAALQDYLDKSQENYEIGMEHFVYEDRSRLRDFLDPRLVKYARGLTLLGTMQDHVEGYFEHPKLRQIMQYTLVFLGGAPRNTPALYNLMSHVDFNLGVFYPEGGIGGVVDALVELNEDLGVEFHADEPVTAIRGTRGNFTVRTDTGEYATDLVVSDADYAHTEQELLQPEARQYDAEYWDSRTYAPSAFMLYLGVEGEVPELAHHTLVLPGNWEDHFDTIFEHPAWPEDPAYYVSVPSETDDTVAPAGHSAVVVLVPIAPGLDDDEATRQAYRDKILRDLADETDTDLRDRIVFERIVSVSEYEQFYNSVQGTALGLAHTLRQTAVFRPGHRSGALDGLYFTGSYTTPGIGVPMTLISGEHTANYVLADER